MRLLGSLIFTFFSLLVINSCSMRSVDLEQTMSKDDVDKRLDYLSEKMKNYMPLLELDSLNIPRSITDDGKLAGTNSRSWTSGFFPGTLWQLYRYSNSETLGDAAKSWTQFVEKEKYDTHTHDLGFKVNNSFGQAYKTTNQKHYKDVVVQTSKTLIKRYNPKIGSIRSWDFNADIWQFPVIIDNMMNLEMLFDATEFTGDSIYYDIAYQHAKTTLKNHFRPDNSSYHVVDYDTISAEPRMKVTHQGHNDDSAWARGQAWGLYGYTLCYARTKDPVFLDKAKSIAEFFFQHPNLPEDMIPYWDFDAPNIPNEPRDVSAATIAASALLELMKYDTENKQKYLNRVDHILTSLEKKEYESDVPPFLLSQSTGSVPGEFEVNVPISYGDYYYVETLLKRSKTN